MTTDKPKVTKKRVLIPGKVRPRGGKKPYIRLGDRKKDRVSEADGREKGEKSFHSPSPPIGNIPDIQQPTESHTELLEMFNQFISTLIVQTKDLGQVVLYEYMYASQHQLVNEIFRNLGTNRRHIVVLKARQMGISTLMLAIDLFWLALHEGMQGALITDTAGNLGKFREIIKQMLSSLPKRFKISFDTSNREMLVFSNGSILDYLTAGVKESGKAVTLGTSRAYNFVHATECSNWANAAGYASLMAALSEHHPNRLFIFESTARGFNLFHEMWMSAKRDPETQACIFIGWWAKDSYRVEGDLFRKYWNGELTEEELESSELVRKLYGVTIEPEQWAWYRWKSETRMNGEGTMESEYPTHEREAFVATGKGFFPVRVVSGDIEKIEEGIHIYPLEPLTYKFGSEFIYTSLEVTNLKECDLKVWEYPNEMGSYVIGVDPAYGRDEDNDRSVIQVYRCYADRMVQVAEFASPMAETHHLAWVICHLAGTYKNCLINMEINGPGNAVKQEMDHLKQMLSHGYMDREFTPADKGLKNFLMQAKYYLYHRPDSMGAGYAYFWKCLALDTPLPTPSGWTTMGEIKKGDELYDERGNICHVIGVSPVHIKNKCYRVTFDDGNSIIADEEHLWSVYRYYWKETKIRKTSKIIAGKMSIPMAMSLQGNDIDLPIEPYVLGFWLGDGCSTSPTFYAHESDMPGLRKNIEACGFKTNEPVRDRTCMRSAIIGLRKLLSEQKLLGNKHIPAQYLRASHQQRLSLLQGLMDTDGTSSKSDRRRCSFDTSNPVLAGQFEELLRTLGIKFGVIKRQRLVNYKGGQSLASESYQYSFSSYDPVFRLERKIGAGSGKIRNARSRHHRIIRLEEVPSVPVKCVMVDSGSHLFLAGNGMVPTHNTNSENKQTIFNQYRDLYIQNQIVVKSKALLEEMLTIVQDGFEIHASGRNKDDRPFATALAVKAWIEWVRQPLINQKKTFAAMTHLEEDSKHAKYNNFQRHIYEDYMKKQKQSREAQRYVNAWGDSDHDLGHEDAGLDVGYEGSEDDGEDLYG